MKKALAFLLIVSLVTTGCAASRANTTTHPVTPGASPDPAIAAFVKSLAPGSRVRVETTSGRSIRGTLLQATDDLVAIERHTRVPEPPVRVPTSEVARVTIDSPAGGARAMAIGAAIGAGAAVGLLWLIAIFAISD